MNTTKKKKQPFGFKAEPEPQISKELAAFLFENELNWWLSSVPKNDIKKLLIQNSFYKKITRNTLNVLLWHHCSAYMHWKRKPGSKSTLLDPERWDKLRSAVEFFREELPGLSMKNACHVIRSRISTNEAQLAGLPARLRYWEQKSLVSST
jgi:hypothetical protein